MEDKIKLSVTSAGGECFEKEVSYVNVPTSYGSLGILSGHAPMLCAVSQGKVRFRFGENETGSVLVGDGVATVADNEVLLLVSKILKDPCTSQE